MFNQCWNCWCARTGECECQPEGCTHYDPIFTPEDDNGK